MIKIDEKYEIDTDAYNWILITIGEGKNKKGETVRREHRTYYPNLRQVCDVLIDRHCKKCETLEEILAYLPIVEDELTELVTRKVKAEQAA